MKRTMIIMVVIILLLVVFSTYALAASPSANDEINVFGKRAGFVDANSDGVCDNAGKRKGTGFVDANNDGVCDNAGKRKGTGFVDADNDGVCDNAGQRSGQGKGYARGNNNSCKAEQ